MKKPLLIACLLLSCFLVVPGYASEADFQRAEELYEKTNYRSAAKWYRKAAKQGHADAQYNLGWMYERGRGVKKDYVQALSWFHKAADQGHADAQYNLGWMYQDGLRTGRDYAKAASWYRKAAAQGDSAAQNNLGSMYYNGLGVGRDYAKAASWYRKAAAQGVSDAQNNLGEMYEYGRGVKKDYVQALSWYRKAAGRDPYDANDVQDQYTLGSMSYRRGDYSHAAQWSRKAAKQGHAKSQYNLGWMYQDGLGLPKNFVNSYTWFLIASLNGYGQGARTALADVSNLLTDKEIAAAKKKARTCLESDYKNCD